MASLLALLRRWRVYRVVRARDRYLDAVHDQEKWAWTDSPSARRKRRLHLTRLELATAAEDARFARIYGHDEFVRRFGDD